MPKKLSPPNKPTDSSTPELIVAPSSEPVSNEPDEFTRLGPVFIDGGAPHQIFKFDKWGLSYGTDDKSHAASIILSMFLGFLLLTIFLFGAFVDRLWIPDAIKILGTALTFTIGVAIGKSGKN